MSENDRRDTKWQDEQRKPSLGGVVLLAVVTALVAGSVIFSFLREEHNYRLPVSQLLEESRRAEGEQSAQASMLSLAGQGDGEVRGPLDVSDVAEAAMPSIVAITSESVQTVEYFFYGTVEIPGENVGSGIIIGQNEEELLIATNQHVIEEADSITVCFSTQKADAEEAIVEARQKGSDAGMDLAVVAVRLSDIPDEVKREIRVAVLGDSDQLTVGQRAVAIGNALGYGQSVTAGVISAVNRGLQTEGEVQDYIQTDAAINFGNSGGALLDGSGRVIGINSAKTSAYGAERMGYAIPINEAKPVLEKLTHKETREKVSEEERGSFGMETRDVSAGARQIYDIPAGVFVDTVWPGSAAEAAGLTRGDIITEVDGTPVSSASALERLLEYYRVGETVEVVCQSRSGSGYSARTLSVTLQKEEQPPMTEQTQEDAYGWFESPWQGWWGF